MSEFKFPVPESLRDAVENLTPDERKRMEEGLLAAFQELAAMDLTPSPVEAQVQLVEVKAGSLEEFQALMARMNEITPEMLEEWDSDGGCEATDGCWVEPDGICEHGKQSWMLFMGLI